MWAQPSDPRLIPTSHDAPTAPPAPSVPGTQPHAFSLVPCFFGFFKLKQSLIFLSLSLLGL